LPGIDPKVNRDALAQYFTWGAVQGPSVIVDAIECLLPGHILHWQDRALQTKAYFTPSWSGKEHNFATHDEGVKAVREGLLESIRAHLISDVPVGVFLSGGLDSTIIAAGMKEVGMSDLRSFSIGYEGEAGVEDESPAAARTAEFLGATHRTETVSAQRLEALFDSYIWSLDQPSGDALNSFLVSRLAAQYVKVSLSGLGADEWFGGYNHHRLAVLARRFGVRPAYLRACTGLLVSNLLGLFTEPMRNCPKPRRSPT
jgi:asparagine synthase (glutamine-hydrolysing)